MSIGGQREERGETIIPPLQSVTGCMGNRVFRWNPADRDWQLFRCGNSPTPRLDAHLRSQVYTCRSLPPIRKIPRDRDRDWSSKPSLSPFDRPYHLIPENMAVRIVRSADNGSHVFESSRVALDVWRGSFECLHSFSCRFSPLLSVLTLR